MVGLWETLTDDSVASNISRRGDPIDARAVGVVGMLLAMHIDEQ